MYNTQTMRVIPKNLTERVIHKFNQQKFNRAEPAHEPSLTGSSFSRSSRWGPDRANTGACEHHQNLKLQTVDAPDTHQGHLLDTWLARVSSAIPWARTRADSRISPL